jgi:hypothetical protein
MNAMRLVSVVNASAMIFHRVFSTRVIARTERDPDSSPDGVGAVKTMGAGNRQKTVGWSPNALCGCGQRLTQTRKDPDFRALKSGPLAEWMSNGN